MLNTCSIFLSAFRGPTPQFLQEVDLPIFDGPTCSPIYSIIDQASEICAGGSDGKDSCQGWLLISKTFEKFLNIKGRQTRKRS